ncbi:Ribosomal protein L35 [Ostreococcus tauri]|uniref:50S ribosomal protein L35 n=1 Tax=Ostreococcus tauri TaxID=70448 RepID=Q01EX4_OSTTA|nr:Ribosomal protein L35 [Ostreococcus tauri]CAL52127.2 Ribosomal protein L35 [Ostreococcus tauri]|eukprot:XP_003074860.1 Ribosomal protein L35 [Ostreococcus tauri]
MCTASLNCASTARFAAQVPSKLSFGKSAAVGAAGSLGRASPSKSTGSRDCFEVTAGKMKTRKSAAKRYKVTASGKVMHRRPGKAHLNGPKTSERKARLGIESAVGTSQMPLVRACLPYAKF